jgi:hypothetical protein
MAAANRIETEDSLRDCEREQVLDALKWGNLCELQEEMRTTSRAIFYRAMLEHIVFVVWTCNMGIDPRSDLWFVYEPIPIELAFWQEDC